MEIKTKFLGKYTNEIDKLIISHSNNQTHIIYGLITLISRSVSADRLKAITGEPLDIRSKVNYS